MRIELRLTDDAGEKFARAIEFDNLYEMDRMIGMVLHTVRGQISTGQIKLNPPNIPIEVTLMKTPEPINARG